MIAFAVCIVSFPALMSQWPALGLKLTLIEQIKLIAGLAPRIDGMSGATPLDALKTALKLGDGAVDVPTLLATQDVFGNFAGRGWEWVTTGYLVGGLWLWQRRIITWHAPLGFLGGLSLLAAALGLEPATVRQSALPSVLRRRDARCLLHRHRPGFRMYDTNRGKLIFGFAAGVMAYIIRVFGGYPDGVAFAVLLMNLCVPLIDRYTQPPIFGMKKQ
jgi:electron transport complex protein RnfD